MNTKAILNKLWPYLAAILLYIVISFAYFSPILEGKKVQSTDGMQHIGVSKEIYDYRKETGKEALWTDALFGGMPTYLISTKYPGNWLSSIQENIFRALPHPTDILILSFVFFFILCLILGMKVWPSFAAGLTYGLFTFSFVILRTGHNTKAHTLAYLALIIAGILFAYKKNKYWGSLISGFGLSWMLSANHLQMTYYSAILIIILAFVYFISAIREKTIPQFLSTSVVLVLTAILAIGTNFSRLYTTYEYGKYSMRGESELTGVNEEKSSGLDKDYILSYSYDLGEAMTSFIPRFKGGGMGESLGERSNVYKFIEARQGKDLAQRISSGLPLYWGSQPISIAPFYFGAVLCFLFVLGIFIVKGTDKWWLLTVIIIAFLLSLGKNFMILSDFMLNYFPGYNKFRDVKNIIVIQQFAMALLGALAIIEIYLRKISDEKFYKSLKYALGITGGLALIFVVAPGLAGDFRGSSDGQLINSGWPEQLIDALRDDRKMVLRSDSFRTLIFVLLSAAGLWAFWTKKIKPQYAIILWVVLILADMWPVNKRYFSNDSFASKRAIEEPFKIGLADKEILKDTNEDYRVLSLNNPFSDGRTSYFHKSIGGYNGAKLERYNELITYRIDPEMRRLIKSFQQPDQMESVLESISVLNMLNTKYIIYDPNHEPIVNNNALGAAWFVQDARFVKNADEEIESLANFDPEKEAIIDERFKDAVPDLDDSTSLKSVISMTEYKPNYIQYEANVKTDKALAVFSEIYYPKGWQAFINGEPAKHFRANYVLRAMIIPRGEHKVEFKFEPKSYFIGNKISLASSLLLILLAAGIVFIEIKRSNK